MHNKSWDIWHVLLDMTGGSLTHDDGIFWMNKSVTKSSTVQVFCWDYLDGLASRRFGVSVFPFPIKP